MKPSVGTFLFRLLFVGLLFGFARPAAAQLSVPFGEGAVQIFSPPAGDSMRVRLLGANDWPLNPICLWTGNSTGADGRTYEWTAIYVGDGLVDGPEPYVNATIISRCTVRLGDTELGARGYVLNLFLPHPSGLFNVPVELDATDRTPAEGDAATWNETTSGDPNEVPPLSFAGNVKLNRAGKLSLDVVFTGGTPPPPTINDLIRIVRDSNLPDRCERILITSLKHARDALRCVPRLAHLRLFQNKVRHLVSDAALAAVLLEGAEALIDSGCDKK